MNETPPITNGVSGRWKGLIREILIGIVLVCAVLAAVNYYFSIPVYRADAGFKKAKQTIDPEKLRAWALEELAKHTAPGPIPKSEIPEYIQKLYSDAPEDAFANIDSIAIMWGGDFGHWGLHIGSTNFTITSDSEHAVVEWVPGIYDSHEGPRQIR